MGLLTVGTPLSWEETQKLAEHVRKHGLAQFIHLFQQAKQREDVEGIFGDEIEYQLVLFDDEKRQVRLYLKAGDILDVLQERERNAAPGDVLDALWRPEYARYMIEGTPGMPYSNSVKAVRQVERNMHLRRQEVAQILPPSCAVLTLPAFPRLGCADFCAPPAKCSPHDPDSAARSLFFPDQAIFDRHPRFASLTRNVRERRGEKVTINCPIYRDLNTPWPFHEHFGAAHKAENCPKCKCDACECSESWTQREHSGASRTNNVYLDAMGFGMGMCCLQVTYQARNVESARALYDQLVPIAPLMLALTAATPIVRGYLLDTDARWYMISASVDDRTPAERGCRGLSCCGPQADLSLPNESDDRTCIHRRIPKSRYDSVDMYLTANAQQYNDIPVVYNERDYKELLAGEVDSILAKHIAHLFVRDTISLFAERVQQDDKTETDHFENIQSTNWQSLRFKPPPSGAADSKIGWRVEFRTMEVQPSDMSNAAFTTLITLLIRAIKRFALNFCLPMTRVEENMRRAQVRDACTAQKFFWRRNFLPQGFSLTDDCADSSEIEYQMNDDPVEVEELTIDEIFNGSDRNTGLIPIIRKLLRTVKSGCNSPDVCSKMGHHKSNHNQNQNHVGSAGQQNGTGESLADELVGDDQTNAILERHLHFIASKCSGELPTFAQVLRQFVHAHPEYQHDSVVSESIAYDICKFALAVANSEISETELTKNYQFFAQKSAN